MEIGEALKTLAAAGIPVVINMTHNGDVYNCAAGGTMAIGGGAVANSYADRNFSLSGPAGSQRAQLYGAARDAFPEARPSLLLMTPQERRDQDEYEAQYGSIG